jgi:hypothetical protein
MGDGGGRGESVEEGVPKKSVLEVSGLGSGVG